MQFNKWSKVGCPAVTAAHFWVGPTPTQNKIKCLVTHNENLVTPSPIALVNYNTFTVYILPTVDARKSPYMHVNPQRDI